MVLHRAGNPQLLPVTLETKGKLRDARRLHSMTFTALCLARYCTLKGSVIRSALASAWAILRAYTPRVNSDSWQGYLALFLKVPLRGGPAGVRGRGLATPSPWRLQLLTPTVISLEHVRPRSGQSALRTTTKEEGVSAMFGVVSLQFVKSFATSSSRSEHEPTSDRSTNYGSEHLIRVFRETLVASCHSCWPLLGSCGGRHPALSRRPLVICRRSNVQGRLRALIRQSRKLLQDIK